MNNDLPKPNSRVEKHLNAIATGDLTGLPKKDHSRVEQYLRYIALNVGTGEGLTQDQKDKLNKIDDISSELETLKSLKTVEIVDETLQLTKDKYQKVNIQDFTDIILPSVSDFCEIHVFFDATDELTLLFPTGVRWQEEPLIEGNKTYEIVFTYTTRWLGGVVVYE